MWNPITILVLVVGSIPLLLLWIVWQRHSNLWMQAFMADAPISMPELIGMTLRKVDASLVVKCRIQLAESGIKIGVRELESAFLQGVDLPRVTTAAIVAKNRDSKLSFKDLVTADLEGQLVDSLGSKVDADVESAEDQMSGE